MGIPQHRALPLIVNNQVEAFRNTRKTNPTLTPEVFLSAPVATTSSQASDVHLLAQFEEEKKKKAGPREENSRFADPAREA